MKIAAGRIERDLAFCVYAEPDFITIDGREHLVHAGEAIVMPAKKPHAVLATEPFKMLLIVLFPEEV